jgi:hypothetical protein
MKGSPVQSEILRVFIGYDPRQPLAYSVLQHSIVKNSSKPVAITPLILSQLPIKRRGLTEFTFSRFLVPWLCNFKGKAVFLDADMVVTGDIAELFSDEADDMSAVLVMQDQARFEWGSVMLFRCGSCLKLTPEFIDNEENNLLDLSWAPYIGHLPAEWNHCAGYMKAKEAKLYHFTQGIPCWYETQGLSEDTIWHEAKKAATHTVPWRDLMGTSVHAAPTMRRMIAKCMG